MKGRAWAVGLALLCLLAQGPAATAQSSFTWTGAAGTSAWSRLDNWEGAAPSGMVGTLTFPALPAGCGGTCYASSNDVTGISANGLSIDNGSPYLITGDGITLGAGGVSAAPPSRRPGGLRSWLSRS